MTAVAVVPADFLEASLMAAVVTIGPIVGVAGRFGIGRILGLAVDV